MIEFSLHLSGQEFRDSLFLIGFIALCYFAYKSTILKVFVSEYEGEDRQ